MERRGGPRPNSGKPKQVKQYSEEFKTSLKSALRRKAKEMGMKDEFDALADLALNLKGHQSAVVASAWKIIADVMTVKESMHHISKSAGPQIYLPEKKAWDGEEKEVGKEGQGRQEGTETSRQVLRH